MARLSCPCGNVLSNVCQPNEVEGTILTHQDMESAWDGGDPDLVDIKYAGRHVWECCECGRIALNYPLRDDATVKWYSPDDGKHGGIMKFVDAEERGRLSKWNE